MVASRSDRPSFRRYAIDLAPGLAILLVMWIKLVCFSILIPTAWWDDSRPVPLFLTMLPVFDDAIRKSPSILTGTLSVLLLFAAPALLLPRGGATIVLLIENCLFTSLAFAQLVHFRVRAELFSLLDFSALPMLWWVSSSVVHLIEPIDVVFYLDIVLGLVLLPVLLLRWRKMPSLRWTIRPLVALATLLASLLLAVPSAVLVAQGASGLETYGSLRIEIATALGILPYHVIDSLNVMKNGEPTGVGQQETQRVQRYLDELRKARDARSSSLFGKARGSNVIIISAESLQSFPIGLTVGGQAVMPKLSEFMRESIYFNNFNEQTYLGSTTDAEFATMQSLYPLSIGLVTYKYPNNTYRGLPLLLDDHGYSTMAMVGASREFWSMNQVHPQFGFRHGYYEEGFQVHERIGPWMADRDFFNQAIPILNQQDGPFMAFMLSSSNHHPYDLPDAYSTLEVGSLEGTMLGKYLQTAHYFDGAFGELIDELRGSGVLDRSVVVVYGDHQGWLNDPPELASLLGFPAQSDYHYLITRKHTPLIIRLPHGEDAGIRSIPASHIDIAPTVLSLLGIKVNDERTVMLGRDLTADGDAMVVFRDGGFTDGQHYFVSRLGATAQSTCYETGGGTAIDCEMLRSLHQKARESLEISDFIITGNLGRLYDR